MTRFLGATPHLLVTDVRRTAEYYDVLGFEIDQYADAIRARGARILEGPVERDYGHREVVVEDCDGHVLVFSEPPSS